MITLNAISLSTGHTVEPVEAPRLFAHDSNGLPQLMIGQFLPGPLGSLITYEYKGRLRLRLVGSLSDPEGTEMVISDCPVTPEDDLARVFLNKVYRDLSNRFFSPGQKWLDSVRQARERDEGRLSLTGLERDIAAIFRSVGYRRGLSLVDGVAFFMAIVSPERDRIHGSFRDGLITRGSFGHLTDEIRKEVICLIDECGRELLLRNWLKRWDPRELSDPVAKLMDVRRLPLEPTREGFHVYVFGVPSSGHLAVEDLGILEQMREVTSRLSLSR